MCSKNTCTHDDVDDDDDNGGDGLITIIINEKDKPGSSTLRDA